MLILNFDGAARGNGTQRGVASFGYVIYRNGIRLTRGHGKCEGVGTNNVAEHAGLYFGLKWLVDNGLTNEELLVHGDSKLVIRQIFGHWKIRNPLPYVPWCIANKRILSNFTNVRGKLVPRDMNYEADVESKKGFGGKVYCLPNDQEAYTGKIKKEAVGAVQADNTYKIR